MNKFFSILLVCYIPYFFSQGQILYTGNISGLCPGEEENNVQYSSEFPDDISQFDALFIFSSANSILSSEDIQKLIAFLEDGKGIYLGSENWPLQAESNQLTTLFYSKQNWGNFNDEDSQVSEKSVLLKQGSIPSGNTTVAFPLDYRLNVDAWINDEPLILSGNYLNGKIIIDGGYSRFYCSEIKPESCEILSEFLSFLTKP